MAKISLTKISQTLRTLLLCIVLVASITSAGTNTSAIAVAQLDSATVFSYQASLSNTSGPITGSCDFKFRLFDSATGTNQVGTLNDRTGVTLRQGLFSTTLDFGNVFNGGSRWLETQIRCPTGSGLYTTLAPRQPILPNPYALTAATAQTANGAIGDFVAKGELRSSRNPVAGAAGSLSLENPVDQNMWATAIRSDDLDRLGFDFWDNVQKSWRFGARLDRDSNFQIRGTMEASTVVANHLQSNGYVESKRVPGGAYPDNGGALVLVNATSGNKWEIPIRAVNNDSLDFYFWNAGLASWHRAVSINKDGPMIIHQRTADNANILTLEHPKAKWLFHVDTDGHPELGVFDVTNQAERWNVLDIDQTTGNLGVGMAASPLFGLLAYKNMAVSTGNAGNTTLLQLHHPKAQLHFNFDENGHVEFQVKNTTTDQFALNVLDIDQTNGHVGIGTNASPTEMLKVDGNFTATGTKAATVATENYGKHKLYAVEAADVRFSDEGLSQLIDGEARIDLDPIFAETIEQPFIITVTPYGDSSLYVAQIGDNFFVVKSREGDPHVTFAWRLSAPRKGYEQVRLESVE